MNVMGALVSFSGIDKNGTGDISGIDACGADTNVAGINVPSNESVSVAGNSFTPTGNPPYDTLKTFTQDSAGREARLGGRRRRAPHSRPTSTSRLPSHPNFPAAATFASDTNYWPIIHVHNRVTSRPGWNAAWRCPGRGAGCSSWTAT